MSNTPDKNILLDELSDMLTSGQLTNKEVLDRLQLKPNTQQVSVLAIPHFDFFKILSFVGGFIIFLGIFILVSINWSSLNDFSQVLITLGGGVGAYILGNILLYVSKTKFTGVSFHLLGGLLLPLGVFTWLSKFPSSDINTNAVAFFVFLGVFVLYLATDYFVRNNIFTLFSWVFATLAYWSAFYWITTGSDSVDLYRLDRWAMLALATIYLLFWYMLKDTSKNFTARYMYFVGVGLFLASIFALVQDFVWLESLYSLVILAAFYLSTVLKSRVLLGFATLDLIVYIFYITSRYFVDVVSWPIALIVVGFLLVGIAYGVVTINKRSFN
jgi:hypothetical protein